MGPPFPETPPMTKLGASYPHGPHLWKGFPEGPQNFIIINFFGKGSHFLYYGWCFDLHL